MGNVETKTMEVVAPRSSLTPCILDDDPEQLSLLSEMISENPGIHVIIITKEYTLESALEAIRRGATDFLPKPLDRLRLKRALDDVASLYDQRRRVRALEEQLLRDLEFHGIVGKSPVMWKFLTSRGRWRGTITAVCSSQGDQYQVETATKNDHRAKC